MSLAIPPPGFAYGCSVTPSAVDLELATDLVAEAARIAAKIRASGALAARTKSNVSDLVTAADLAAEKFVVEQLATLRPADGIVGEEGAFTKGTSGRRWVIDPVDGTYNFAAGSDYWCSAIALAVDDQPVLGAVAQHASGTVWAGGPEFGTNRNGVALAPLADRPVAELSLATYAHPTFIEDSPAFAAWSRAAHLPATIRMLGSGSMDLALVASGGLGCWLQHSTPVWDWLPGAALLAGVGGTCIQVEAHGLIWSVAGPPAAVTELVSAL